VAWEIYRPQRGAFLALAGVMLVCTAYRWLIPGVEAMVGWFPDCCVLLLGLSLAAAFVLFKFTDSERRERFTGFPSRLFTMPVRTIWLLTWPMLYGVATVVLLYVAWAGFVLRPGRPEHFPFLFPSLYLATGMICFQAIVWTFARTPVLRLVVLGVWGAALTTAWLAFSPLVGKAQVGLVLAEMLHISVRTAQSALLLSAGAAAYAIAWWSVSRQRHGVRFKWSWPRLALVSLALRFRVIPRRFDSPRAAQFWFEWRRNGMILPAIVGVLLLLIVAPFFAVRPFWGPAAQETVLPTLVWMLVLPFALAFIIGQGFGKTNFWGQGLGKELGVPQFIAVRPLTAADWLGVKLKAAALSAAVTWSVVALVITAWLITCCDLRPLGALVLALPSFVWLGALAAPLSLLLLLAMLLTWRLLIANIYLGILGNRGLFNTAFCVVFLMIFGPMPLIGWCLTHPEEAKNLLVLLPGLQWLLVVLVALKLGLALRFLLKATRSRLVSTGGALGYFSVWIWGTQLLLLLVLVAPVTDALARVLGLLALLALPLARIALAPLAFAQSRVR
jgi:hypothetical protein